MNDFLDEKNKKDYSLHISCPIFALYAKIRYIGFYMSVRSFPSRGVTLDT